MTSEATLISFVKKKVIDSYKNVMAATERIRAAKKAMVAKKRNPKGPGTPTGLSFARRGTPPDDDGSDPSTALRLYEKLIAQDKVDLVLGPFGGPITEAVADVTEKYKMPDGGSHLRCHMAPGRNVRQGR